MEDIERSNLARTIKKYRKARKLTMEQLSEKSGINLSTLKKYETDNRNPKLEQLSKIAEALEVSVFEFLDIEVKSVNDIISLVNKIENCKLFLQLFLKYFYTYTIHKNQSIEAYFLCF